MPRTVGDVTWPNRREGNPHGRGCEARTGGERVSHPADAAAATPPRGGESHKLRPQKRPRCQHRRRPQPRSSDQPRREGGGGSRTDAAARKPTHRGPTVRRQRRQWLQRQRTGPRQRRRQRRWTGMGGGWRPGGVRATWSWRRRAGPGRAGGAPPSPRGHRSTDPRADAPTAAGGHRGGA